MEAVVFAVVYFLMMVTFIAVYLGRISLRLKNIQYRLEDLRNWKPTEPGHGRGYSQ